MCRDKKESEVMSRGNSGLDPAEKLLPLQITVDLVINNHEN